MLTPEEARSRLEAADHGVLSTVHPDRGVDAVPCVFALDGDVVGVPIDRLKPKRSQRLQRATNLEADPRATLLVDHWDPDDWDRLWWVRAELRWEPSPEREPTLADRLAARYPQYRDRPFSSVLVLCIVRLTGWSAS